MSHISFSALKIWKDCPHKYKLIYVENKQPFAGSEYTAFGTAIHEACEMKLLNESVNEVEHFEKKFEEEVQLLKQSGPIKQDMIDEMREQGKRLAAMAIPALKNHFGNFSVVNAEEDLLEQIPDNEKVKFKGFIDLIIKTEDGKIHILDWKTCSWGWDMKKKSDPMVTYQLTFYKHFYAQKYHIDPDNIETHFALLKRTAKRDNVEIFRVTSGAVKTKNAFKVLNQGLASIEKGFYPKNRTSCKYCEFYKTENCT